ncbi:ExbD/TolR family protein [Mucisphaera calidilacus]|uniref:Biopolymer transport protein ExbD n=1 Tax=Mucisphaera calidilacus TaxID=2527982 RepID=A0A518BUH8_9BACT|nr:biopolymer transporter ExbD [Mucisphaera calidilacus]QDU70601.1 biopolymer transport protein ExbD [Mucisphaera calidilacus]
MGRFTDYQSGDDGETKVDISPLIDCVFILLIFFIVTTSFVQETGIEVDKPQPSSQPTNDEKTTIVLRLDESGRVFYEGRDIGIAGVQSEVKRVLQSEEAPVIVQASFKAPVGSLVRVMDEARIAGATRVSLAQTQ